MCIDDQKKDQMTARRRILLNLTTSKCLRNSWTALIPTTTAIAIATNTKTAILLTTIFLVSTTRIYSFRWQLPPNILYD
jgi:hypothetical protein